MVSRDVVSADAARRIHAALSWEEGLQLFLQNRGAAVEELHVDFTEDPASRAGCLGSHALEPGKFVILELERQKPALSAQVSIVGGPDPITLAAPPVQKPRGRFDCRIRASVAGAAAVLVLIVAALIQHQTDQRTAPVAAMAVVSPPADTGVALLPPRKMEFAPPRKPRSVARPPVARRPAVPAPISVLQPARPPTIRISTVAGAFRQNRIAVAFRSDASRVHLFAQIGPKKIANDYLARGNGTVYLTHIPPSRNVRVLTITAAAFRGHASSSRSVMVVLLPDSRSLWGYTVADHTRH